MTDVGASRQEVVVDGVTRTQIVQYAGATGDFSPLHTDELAARAAGHVGLMAHGMLTLAATTRLVTDWFGHDAVRTLSARFTAPVWPGDALTARATVAQISVDGRRRTAQLALETRNEQGTVVLTGTADVDLRSTA